MQTAVHQKTEMNQKLFFHGDSSLVEYPIIIFININTKIKKNHTKIKNLAKRSKTKTTLNVTQPAVIERIRE